MTCGASPTLARLLTACPCVHLVEIHAMVEDGPELLRYVDRGVVVRLDLSTGSTDPDVTGESVAQMPIMNGENPAGPGLDAADDGIPTRDLHLGSSSFELQSGSWTPSRRPYLMRCS